MTIQCEHFRAGNCGVASQLADLDIPTTESMCGHCQQHRQPMQVNVVTASLAWATLRRTDAIEMPKHQTIVDVLSIRSQKPINDGPGEELKKLISWFYSPEKRKCKCKTRIQKMNKWGPDGCEQRMETIVRWLKHSARIANIPFFRPVAVKLIRTAIARARSKSALSR